MASTRKAREIPLRFDDAFRGGISMGIPVLAVLVIFLLEANGVTRLGSLWLVVIAAGALTVAFFAYILWTHMAFARAPKDMARRIARAQHSQEPSALSRMFGFSNTESWAVSAASAALMGAVAATVFGARTGGGVLLIVVLLAAATAWTTVVYAFALRYFRLHAAGESFRFEVDGQPEFTDFVTFALMLSSAGTLAAASPTTRTGLRAVRAHTVIAFAFNALVIAMTVSLISGLITTFGS